MTEELMTDWLKFVLEHRPNALLGQRGILILDTLHGHTTEKIKKQVPEVNIDLVIISRRMTSQF